jgi:hypothetical protein
MIKFDMFAPASCRSSGAKRRGKRHPARFETVIDIAKDSFTGRWLESAIEQDFDLDVGFYITSEGYQIIISKTGIKSDGKG